jgi:hypothetical protein
MGFAPGDRSRKNPLTSGLIERDRTGPLEDIKGVRSRYERREAAPGRFLRGKRPGAGKVA